MAGNSTISSSKDFPNTKTGMYKKWQAELEAGRKAKRKWVKQGGKVVKRFLGDKPEDGDLTMHKSLNLFHANTMTLKSLLFGNAPRVDLSRTNTDANDDGARVAAEMLERMLNVEFEDPGLTTTDDLQQALEDRLIPGFGLVRVRYEYETEEVEQEAVMITNSVGESVEVAPPTVESKLLAETAPTEYVHWRDATWSPCRTWSENRWLSFKVQITEDEAAGRWGTRIAKKLPKKGKNTSDYDTDSEDLEDENTDAWNMIELEEIWCKDTRNVYWYCEGYDKILEVVEDPLELQGFWPCPRPMVANLTTTAFMPTPDYKMAEDLYVSIDTLTTRIELLVDALRVVGLYAEEESDGLGNLLNGGLENVMIPVSDWAAFAEKGGIEGVVSWFPVGQIAEVLGNLTAKRQEDIALLSQTTGMADVMRASGGGPVRSAAEKSLEAKFGSVYVQALQDEFARFASDLMRIKAEIISLHFDDETIVGQSGMQYSMDQEAIPEALKLLRDPAEMAWRVQIKPESVAMVDYAQLKEERVEYIQSISLFMQSAMGLVEQSPEAAPVMLEMLKWGMAGFKGSSGIEGVLDRAIQQLQQAQQQPEEEQPDPEQLKAQAAAEAEKAKHQARMEQIEAEKASKLEIIQADLQADLQKMQYSAQADVEEAQAKHEQELAEIAAEAQAQMDEILAEHEAEMAEIRAELQASKETISEQAKLQTSTE